MIMGSANDFSVPRSPPDPERRSNDAEPGASPKTLDTA